ncbi:MAG: efflux RND transporter periplasmic adaptor subunit [Cytophagales bacterium]|nr:MAG: efflux RND transporter periplasmic adaptor subunit [Cytophagales bacterium]
MNNKNIILQIFKLIIYTIVTFYLISCGSSQAAEKNSVEKYIVFQPIITDSSYVQEYVAEIQSIQNIEIRSRVRGFIEQIYIDEGAEVSKGQLLFSLNVRGYQEEILKANAQLRNAEAELKQIEIETENIKILVQNNVVSNSELALIQAKKDAILAKIEDANASIEVANLYLSFTQIRAPFNGFIGRIPYKIGSLLEEGDLLTNLSNNTEIFAYFNISENDYLKYIDDANFSKSVYLKMANGNLFSEKGVIETIDSEIDKNTGNLAFRARFPNKKKILKHGASGKILVSIPIAKALLIPQKSTFEVQENLYVYVVNHQNKIELRKIQVSERLGNFYVVRAGLSSKDKVLYEGIQFVREGSEIIPDLKSIEQLKSSFNTK